MDFESCGAPRPCCDPEKKLSFYNDIVFIAKFAVRTVQFWHLNLIVFISVESFVADDEKSPDETVDGPGAAAAILNSMRPAQRERIMKAMQQASPEVAVKVEEKLYNFEEVADLQPQGVQILIKEIEHRDLVLSLKTASDKVKKVLFDNMTERRRQIVSEDFAALPQVKLRDVEEAQRRIMIKLSALRTSGLLKTQSKNDVWV